MSYLVHHDTLVAAVRGNQAVINRMRQHQGSLHLSVCTLTGVETWLLHPRTSFRFTQTYFSLLQQLTLLDLDESMAIRAASIGSRLAIGGQPITTVNLFVAATALVRNLTLVTSRTQTFSRVPGLTLVDWRIP